MLFYAPAAARAVAWQWRGMTLRGLLIGSDTGDDWHNGGTGGFSSFVAFDRAAGKAVGIVTNMGDASSLVDRAGFKALGVKDPLVG